jgi:DNA-binding IscR family transcriptional regulator
MFQIATDAKLTTAQRSVLEAACDFSLQHKKPPTTDEIAAICKIDYYQCLTILRSLRVAKIVSWRPGFLDRRSLKINLNNLV